MNEKDAYTVKINALQDIEEALSDYFQACAILDIATPAMCEELTEVL